MNIPDIPLVPGDKIVGRTSNEIPSIFCGLAIAFSVACIVVLVFVMAAQ